MKIRNQILRVLLVFTLLMAFSSMSKMEVRADVKTQETTEKEVPNTASGTFYNLNWSVSGTTLTITGSGEMKNEYFHSYYPWSEYDSKITKLVIGNYVTSLGGYAFSNMSLLSEVSIGSRVTTIGECTFSNCDSLVAITIPNNVISIGYGTFSGCNNLTEVKFGANSKLATIGKYAFEYCINLQEFVFPAKVTSIGDYAFQYCSNLTSIDFNAKLQSIGMSAFCNCDNLIEADFPASVRTIGEYAFYDCDSLMYIDIKYGLKEIGESAFYGCNRISGSVKIPGTVTSLGKYTFQYCSNIEEVLIYCATYIPRYAFDGCASLKKVTIGGTVTGVGGYSFRDTNLSTVNIPGSVSYISDYAFYDVTSLTKATLASGLTEICDSAFSGTSITSITVPDTCVSIEQYAFYNCAKLKNVKLGSNVTSIGKYAFSDCNSLTSVTMGNTLTSIGNSAFRNCVLLKDIVLSNKLNSIGNYAFYNCDSLDEIILPESLVTIGSDAFSECSSLSTVELGMKVTKIGSYAFYNCISLNKFRSYSGNISFDNSYVFTNAPVTIYCWADSAVEEYANKYGITFSAIKTLDTPKNKKIANAINGVEVSWNYVRGASYYTLYRSESENGTYSVVKKVISSTSYTDTTVSSGKTYYYKVEARNTSASSAMSAVQKQTYVATPTITSRTNIAAGIKLGWNKVANATGYAVYRKTGTSAWTRVYTATNGNTVTWTDAAVKANNGKIYKYTIRAIYGDIYSGCRDAGLTMVRLTSRNLKSVTKASKTSIKCTWDTSSAVSGYEIRFVVNGKVLKTQTVGNYKTGAKTVTGLTAGKKYQVQVRSYKKTDAGTYYSAWSTAKYVQL